MPSTALWVLPANALTWLKANGFVAQSTTQVRIEIRPFLPPKIYTDKGAAQPPGAIQLAEAIHAWLVTNTIIDDTVKGVYIDCPAEVVDTAAVAPRADLTDLFNQQAILDFLRATPRVR